MTDFTPITTQEEFDAKIQERLQRQRNSIEKELAEKYSKEFSDYEDLQELAQKSQSKVDELSNEIQKLTQTNSDYENQVKGLNQTVSSFEQEKLKTEIALKKGLPYELAQRLVGENETELRKDAERLSELIGSTKPSAPLKDVEPNISGDPIGGALNELVTNLSNQGEL